MFALGLARALRGPSELVTLDLDHIGTPDARSYIEVGLLGITIRLTESKTSQEATREMFILRGPAGEAVEAWILPPASAAGPRCGAPSSRAGCGRAGCTRLGTQP